ncbi:hypothetical protein L6R52_11965 [Myxococcota bacterium]|nr:hypothetical protein [Myxococcota bacterium]
MSAPRSRALRVLAVLAAIVIVAIVAVRITTGLGPLRAVTYLRCELAMQSGKPCSIVPELGHMCDVATEQAAATGDDAARLAAFAREVHGRVETRRGQRLVDTIVAAPASRRGKLVRAAADAAGAQGWSCPPLDQLLAGTSTTTR